MPIRINLKELFPADAQEITIDKINFNFNKLLALGVGDAGPIGLSGIQGSAGPVGGAGSQGVRGSTWIVDSGAPTITTGLLDGDLYLDSNALAVYQWDEMTSTWTFLFDISAIVQNYLNAAASPFVRGFGAGSPDDQRFIVFGKKDGTLSDDFVNGSNSTNDVLFLSNYDEAIITPNPPVLGGSPDTTDFYGALLNISVDQRSLLPNLRSHLELGMLYDPVNPTLTSISENFKVRYDRIGASKHIGLDHYNRTAFSLDVLDSFPSTSRNFSSVFAFESPKYQPLVHPSLSSSERSIVLVGSRYGLDEEAPSALSGDTLADGIVFYTSPAQAGGNIGTAINYSIAGITGVNTGYFDFSTPQSHFMLDPVGTATSLYFRGTTYQNEGNLVQLGTSAARLTGSAGVLGLSAGLTPPYPVSQNIALAQHGNKIFSIAGYKSVTDISTEKNSAYSETIIENANLPASHLSRFYTENPSTTLGRLDFAGISDIVVAGDYMYCVKCLSVNNTSPSGTSTSPPKLTIQTLKLNDDRDQLPTRTSYGDFSNTLLDSLHRIKLRGNLAVVTSNALPIGPTTNNLGGSLVPGNTYDGRVLLFDITCPELTTLVDSVVATKTGVNTSTRAAFMDMDVVDDLVYTLTWEQTPNGGNANVIVKVDAFSIEGADSEPATSVIWKTDTNSVTNGKFLLGSVLVNSTDYGNLSKVGAICANKKYVYAAYSIVAGGIYTPEVRIFNTRGGVGISGSPGSAGLIPASLTLAYSSKVTLNAGVDINEINKIQQVGNSLYVLANSTLDGSYLFKVDVSNPTSPFQVWSTQLASSAQRFDNFILKGKHIYVVNTKAGVNVGNANNTQLRAFEIDGFYTGAAHIESLRTDEFDVTQNLAVGNNAIINNELNVGGRTEIVGELGVGTRLRMCGGSYFTGDSSNSNIVANIVNGSGALVIKNLNANQSSTLSLVNGSTTYFELKSVPASTYVEIAAKNNSALYTTTSGANNVIQATSGDVNLTTLTSGDVNVTAADKFIVNANTAGPLHLTPKINQGLNTDIITSGVYASMASPNDVQVAINWIRIGRVVTCNGRIQILSGNTGQVDFYLPVYAGALDAANSARNIVGNAWGVNYGGLAGDPTRVGDWGTYQRAEIKARVGEDTPATVAVGTVIYCSFSYVLN